MKPEKDSIFPLDHLSDSDKQNHGFTLTELLVVILSLGVLVVVALPALAGAQNKAGRMQCADNLRQIYVASMVYAGDYQGWLPVNTVELGSANINRLNGLYYTYYVTSAAGFSTPNAFIPTNAPASYFSDLGHLYNAGLAGNGQIFYCPDAWGSPYGANFYLPLLTSDFSGRVRSSYAFNPRTLDPTNADYHRAYQTTGDLPPHKLFAVDYFGIYGATSFRPSQSAPHFRDGGGWNVLFTDGSVEYSRNAQANALIQSFSDNATQQSQEMEYQILNLLELDH